jgi:hypothetical protein
MKQPFIIIAVIIALCIIAAVVFINILFFGGIPLPPPEPEKGAVSIEEILETGQVAPAASIPDTQDEPQPDYVIPAVRIPTPQEMEERAKKEDERRRALEEMNLKMKQESELIRAEAYRKLREEEEALLNAKPGESKQGGSGYASPIGPQDPYNGKDLGKQK